MKSLICVHFLIHNQSKFAPLRSSPKQNAITFPRHPQRNLGAQISEVLLLHMCHLVALWTSHDKAWGLDNLKIHNYHLPNVEALHLLCFPWSNMYLPAACVSQPCQTPSISILRITTTSQYFDFDMPSIYLGLNVQLPFPKNMSMHWWVHKILHDPPMPSIYGAGVRWLAS